MTEFVPYRKERAGVPIPGGRQVETVLNLSVTDSAWTTVSVPTGKMGKALMMKLRSNSAWKLRKSGESNYITIEDTLALDIAVKEGETICQVQTDTGADTLEVLFLD